MHEANKKRAPEGSVAKSGAFRLGSFPLNSAHEFAAPESNPVGTPCFAVVVLASRSVLAEAGARRRESAIIDSRPAQIARRCALTVRAGFLQLTAAPENGRHRPWIFKKPTIFATLAVQFSDQTSIGIGGCVLLGGLRPRIPAPT